MRAYLNAALIAALLPLPAVAETPMSAAEFDAYATGKTLTYAYSGSVFGTEEYLPGRAVRWAFTEDKCQYGKWYEKDTQICFLYEDDPDEQCWEFFNTPTGLRAQFMGGAGTELSEVEQSTTGLGCPGPDVGV
jgi:hypothetical protein